jgi:hypothetical protein
MGASLCQRREWAIFQPSQLRPVAIGKGGDVNRGTEQREPGT